MKITNYLQAQSLLKGKRIISISLNCKGVELEPFFKNKTNNIAIWINNEIKSYVYNPIIEIDIDRNVENRYKEIENVEKLLKDKFHSTNNVFPRLFGGFSFFDTLKGDQNWNSFSRCKFNLYNIEYREDKTKSIIISNSIIEESSNLESQINKLRDHLSKSIIEIGDHTDNNKIDEELQIDSVNFLDTKSTWVNQISKLTKEIDDEKLIKVVLSRRKQLYFHNLPDKIKIISRLKQSLKNATLFLIDFDGNAFFGASPELLISKTNEKARTMALAGSEKYNLTIKLEDAVEQLKNEKNLKEHKIVVDQIQEILENMDLKSNYPVKPEIYEVSNLIHLMTPISIENAKDRSIFEFIEKFHPTPALGGKPKIEALRKIREIEQFDRGWYGAPIGWFDLNDDGYFIVGIRSSILFQNKLLLYAGAGIVKESDPEKEFEETETKFKPILASLGVN